MLRAIRTLLTEDKWTAGALARNDDGFGVHPLDPSAVKWCLVGACGKVAWEGAEEYREVRFQNLMSAFVYVLDGESVTHLPNENDMRGFDWAVELLDKAISALLARR